LVTAALPIRIIDARVRRLGHCTANSSRLSAVGNVRTESLRAFSAAGMTKIVGKILDAGDPDLESSDRRRSFPL
jgi:hypothetical protein